MRKYHITGQAKPEELPLHSSLTKIQQIQECDEPKENISGEMRNTLYVCLAETIFGVESGLPTLVRW